MCDTRPTPPLTLIGCYNTPQPAMYILGGSIHQRCTWHAARVANLKFFELHGIKLQPKYTKTEDQARNPAPARCITTFPEGSKETKRKVKRDRGVRMGALVTVSYRCCLWCVCNGGVSSVFSRAHKGPRRRVLRPRDPVLDC